MVNVTLNTFDADGNVVDTDNMDLKESQVSDIVDHAAQLAIVMRDIAAKRNKIEDFDQVFSELEDALVSAGVIEQDLGPLPVFVVSSPE